MHVSRTTFVALATLCALLWAPHAVASHYRLPASGLVTRAELSALKTSGISDTKVLFERSATLHGRKALAKSTGIGLKRLSDLAAKCDLLRVTGLGPTMMRLIQAAGVTDLRALSSRSASTLHARLQSTNESHRLSEVVPGNQVLSDWIAQARKLPQILE